MTRHTETRLEITQYQVKIKVEYFIGSKPWTWEGRYRTVQEAIEGLSGWLDAHDKHNIIGLLRNE